MENKARIVAIQHLSLIESLYMTLTRSGEHLVSLNRSFWRIQTITQQNQQRLDRVYTELQKLKIELDKIDVAMLDRLPQ